ncbi:MAG: hypothetical protein PHV30_07855 [Candidatus Margulisbacteria bacterium]|nr:hypothetical protein [Candidatus Margulisiibacteriota bacterium]
MYKKIISLNKSSDIKKISALLIKIVKERYQIFGVLAPNVKVERAEFIEMTDTVFMTSLKNNDLTLFQDFIESQNCIMDDHLRRCWERCHSQVVSIEKSLSQSGEKTIHRMSKNRLKILTQLIGKDRILITRIGGYEIKDNRYECDDFREYLNDEYGIVITDTTFAPDIASVIIDPDKDSIRSIKFFSVKY